MMTHRLRLVATGLAAIILTTALVVGVPAALIAHVGWPLPTALPTLEEVQLALRSGIDPQLVVNLLAVIVWVIWLQLVTSLTVEVVAVVRGRTAAVLLVLPGLQQTAARLVATITLVAAGLAPVKAPPALALPSTAAATVSYAPLSATFEEEPARQAAPTRPEQQHVAYTTKRHDTLWGIAERALGDGRRWQEIRQLNPDQVGSDGSVEAGVELRLPADAAPPSPVATEVSVEKGEHFWSIAEDALTEAWGRPPTDEEITPYWRQVVDTNQNRLVPPHDPNLIHPGQVFRLPPNPADPLAVESIADASESPAGSEVVVEPDDNLWSIAETALAEAWRRPPTDSEILPYWSRVIAVNRDHLVDSDNPSHILPGQVFWLPAISADPTITTPEQPAVDEERSSPSEPAPTPEPETANPPTTRPSPATTRPSTTTRPQAEEPADTRSEITVPPADTDTDARDEVDVEDDEEDGGLLPVAARLAGLGFVAAGLIALIDRLRRRQLQHRRPDTLPSSPPAEAASVEAEMRAAASLEGVELVDVAIRALGRQIVDSHLPAPHVVGIHLSNDHVKVLLWTPHPDPPSGWHAEDDGTIWSLSTTTDLTHLRLLADGTPAPYPTMVTAGHDDHSQLLIDLEFPGALTVTGDPGEVAAACRTIALELAASPIADQVQVVCIGFGSDLAHLERITVREQVDDVLLSELEDRIAAFGEVDANTLETRLGPGGDNTYPLVVIDPTSAAPSGAERILAAAQTGRGVSAVVGYPTGDRWQLRITGGTVVVEPLGISLRRRDLTPQEHNAVADLVATAKDLDGVPADTIQPFSPNGHQPAESEEPETPQPERVSLAEEQGEGLGVRVLGTIRIDRCEGHFASRKAAELPVYLALHRAGVEADAIMEALWPGEAPDFNRFNRTTSRARTPLGVASDGELYLPRVVGGIYRVSPRLGCDLDRFTAHIRQADQSDGTDRIAHLKAGLELVEGTPFSGTGNGYVWAWEEGLVSHAIVAVDDTAHQLAGLALDTGEPDLATWAARKGLLSTTRCEECYRNLMRAAIAQGSQTALDAIFSELTTVVDADDGPDATAYLDPVTIELYEQHTRTRRR